ncbi:hypothetical protein PAXINDRAFT_93008, partial [Paxillus involutus ATCC 200175]
MNGHENYVYQIAYLPGRERIVSCSQDNTVRVWYVENGEQEGTSMTHKHGVHGLAVTRDGKSILSGGQGNSIRLWDVETHNFVKAWGGHTSMIFCIALSPDDKLVASGDRSGKIVLREINDGREIPSRACRLALRAHNGIVTCVLWSLDGSRLFSSSVDRTIRCWNSDTGKPIGEPWKGHTQSVNSLSLSPDGTKLASVSDDKTIRFWDSHSGDPIAQPLQHDNFVDAVTFSPCGEFVASGGRDNKVSIW